MNTKKKTLAVLFGGHSSEYEVSLQSAAAVLEAVDTERFDPLPIGITKDGNWHHYLGTYSAIAAGTLSAHSPHARLCRGVSLSCKLHPSVLRRQQLRRADLIPADQRRACKRERQRPRVRL